MSRKRYVVKNRRIRKAYFSLLLVCLITLGFGFAIFSSDLDIMGLLEFGGYKVPANTAWDFDYKGEIQTFKVPQNGIYRLEAWGAQ